MERGGFDRVAVCTMGRALAQLGARLGMPKPIVLSPWPSARRQRVLREIRRLEAGASIASSPGHHGQLAVTGGGGWPSTGIQ
ncbi:MAG: hypothetical protein ABIS92_08860 [Polyangia bacterium]